MKEYTPKGGGVVPISLSVSDMQKVRVGCGSYPKECGFSVLAINSEEGKNPSHFICALSGNNNVPWCGVSDLYPPESLGTSKTTPLE